MLREIVRIGDIVMEFLTDAIMVLWRLFTTELSTSMAIFDTQSWEKRTIMLVLLLILIVAFLTLMYRIAWLVNYIGWALVGLVTVFATVGPLLWLVNLIMREVVK